MMFKDNTDPQNRLYNQYEVEKTDLLNADIIKSQRKIMSDERGR